MSAAYVPVTTASRLEKPVTQKLRDLIALSECGLVSIDQLHNALFELETTLGLPFTTPDEEADYDEEEADE